MKGDTYSTAKVANVARDAVAEVGDELSATFSGTRGILGSTAIVAFKGSKSRTKSDSNCDESKLNVSVSGTAFDVKSKGSHNSGNHCQPQNALGTMGLWGQLWECLYIYIHLRLPSVIRPRLNVRSPAGEE